jgi:hypothetical protein
MKLDAICSTSKKFLVARETVFVLPSLQAFSRLLDATIELHHLMVQEGNESLGAAMAFKLWRVVLTIWSDATLLWKRWR